MGIPEKVKKSYEEEHGISLDEILMNPELAKAVAEKRAKKEYPDIKISEVPEKKPGETDMEYIERQNDYFISKF